MEITLELLKTRWDEDRISAIQSNAFFIGSEKLMRRNGVMVRGLDAVWSEDHDHAVAKKG
jgi:hypothetical protein